MKTNYTLGRREFLQKAARTAATTAVFGATTSTVRPAETPVPAAGGIPARALGRTGLKLPILGYGGAALPSAWFNPLSQAQRVELVRYAYDRGLRYFDTSPVYMESETILGEALKDRRREVSWNDNIHHGNPRIAIKRSQAIIIGFGHKNDYNHACQQDRDFCFACFHIAQLV